MNGRVTAHAPGRVNLIGDHTDYCGGLALPCAIDLGITIDGVVDERIVLRSSLDDGVVSLDRPVDLDGGAGALPADLPADLPIWGRYVAAVAALLPSAHGLSGRIESDLPAGAGLSSSAALEIAVALALGFDGAPMDLARLGQRAEHLATGTPTGLLDQIAITHAVAGHATCIDFTTLAVEPVAVPADLDIVVVHSGQERTVAASAYAERVDACTRAAALVGSLPFASVDDIEGLDDPVLRRRARHVGSETARVRAAVEALRIGDFLTLGAVMTESHASLRDDFEVSTPVLDALVERLLRVDGVHGARLTGAGFGGCVVAVCDEGAIVDPTAFTGRGWIVQPTGAAQRT
jgi:galactokinase